MNRNLARVRGELINLAFIFLCMLPVRAAGDAVWQYSVPAGYDPLRRAYLWIPEKCQHVRGIIIGIQNMLEQSIFEDPVIRQAATDTSLGIVWITPGDDNGDKASSFHKFNPPADIVQGVQRLLADLAMESGYSEIENAPLLVTGHSAATPFVWGMDTNFDSERMIAIFPIKGWFGSRVTPGIPVFHIGSEYAEVGGEKWGETYLKDRVPLQRLRGEGEDRLLGEFVDIGAGHFEWNPDADKVIAMFIRKAVQLRLPAKAGEPLKTIDPKSGWLIDPGKLGTPDGKPVAAKDWPWDASKAFWYFDEEMARAVNDYMVAGLSKKPQVIDFLDDKGQPEPLAKGGNPVIPALLMDDGFTFKVAATSLDKSPTVNLYDGVDVGHAPGPILFKVGSSALKQTGPDTFRVWMRRGGVIPQGAPWEPWIIAWHPGNDEFRRSDRPGRPRVTTYNKDGAPQTIDFLHINDLRAARTVQLHATSDLALPIQFYVVSGPAELSVDDNTTLKILPIPPRSKFPVKVIVGAYQWGRPVEPKVQTAWPVFQEFYIKR
jgi:hypothetical protein